MRALRRNGWTLGLALLLAALLLLTKLIQPNFGASGLGSLARAALPFAFAAAAMSVVVIAGGIDLSVASMMAVAGVTAARLMQAVDGSMAIPVVLLVLLVGAAMGAVNGLLIVWTRLPDIVVTLAMLFVWEGTALLILQAPGGAATPWLREAVLRPLALPGVPASVTALIPKSLVVLAVILLLIWLPLRRSKLGLSIYAVGSDATAAFRSLTGGKGGLLGPILAVFILRTLRLDLTLLSVDPNVTTIVEGTILALIVMMGGLLAMRERRA
jgi:ribose transport system permease protein